jgi:hypothetical protein
VAAVKGTDPEYSTDGDQQSSVKVFSSENPVALVLTGSDGKETELHSGEKLVVDGTDSTLGKIDEQDIKDSDKSFEGLPEPKLEEGPGAGNGEVGQGQAPTPAVTPAQTEVPAGQTTADAASKEAAQTQNDLAQDIQDAFSSAVQDVSLDNFLDRDEKTGDLAAGRIVIDRNGDRAQVSAYILRPAANQVQKLDYTKRDTGPFAGTSSAIETSTWSAALPANWYDAVKMALNDPANLDPKSGYPILYRQSQDFVAMNPAGDKLEIVTAYDPPNYRGFYDPVNLYWTTDPSNPIDPLQTFKRDVYTGPGDISSQTPVFSFQQATWLTADAVNAGRNVTTSPGLGYYVYSWNTAQTLTPDNGIHLDFQSALGGPTFLSMEFRILDNDGTKHDLSGMPAGLTQGSFRGLDQKLNLEVTFNAPNFSAPIDILFIPAVFDAMDILDLPAVGGPPA